MTDYKIYPTELLNNFYLELFSSEFRDYESTTENSKTDYLSDYDDDFDEWFEMLIDSFVDDTGCDEEQLRIEIENCPKFVEDMKSEYEQLLEILSDDF
jgi:hypothetical protein